MYMRFSALIFAFILLFQTGCNKNEVKIVVYPNYCKGCVMKNFPILKDIQGKENIALFFDTTDVFLRSEANLNNLLFKHVENDVIPSQFGDFANLVVIKGDQAIELRTNEKIEKGTHY